MRLINTLLTAAILALLTPPHASATTLLAQGMTLRDTSTKLVWLDLTQTKGLPPGAALGANPSFRFATLGEVFDLFETAGFDGNLDTPNAANFAAADTLITGLAATDSDSLLGYPRSFGQGWAVNGTGFNNPFYEVSFPSGLSPRGRFVGGNTFSSSAVSASNVGTFLVKPVPLPAGLLLLLSALTAFGWLNRRRKPEAMPV